jgi:hypothetical protein
MRGILILLGHFMLLAIAWQFELLAPRYQSIRSGDPATVFGGVFFLYWGCALLYVGKSNTRDWLFNLIGGEKAVLLGTLFFILGATTTVVGLLPKSLAG